MSTAPSAPVEYDGICASPLSKTASKTAPVSCPCSQDSLETRVDLMSQMQETRNAISQMPTSPPSPYPSPQKSSPVGDLLDITQKMSPEYPDFSELSTNLHPADWVAPRLVMPFTRDLCGTNLQISEEGYRAARIRGCRQSVAIGSAPLILV